jgi:hypothetical protein
MPSSTEVAPMFTIEGFIESCRKTIVASDAERVIRELVIG